MTPPSEAVRFEERQTVPSWLAPAVFVLAVPSVVLAVGTVFGTEGVDRSSLSTVGVVVLVSVVPIPVVARMAMRTRVTEDALAVRFWPFHRTPRELPVAEITEVQVEAHRSFNYGVGWTPDAWTYVPRGGEGVRIERREKKAVFVGSERPRELARAIRTARRDDVATGA